MGWGQLEHRAFQLKAKGFVVVVGPCRLFCALGNWAEQYKTGFSEWILYGMGFVTY